MLIVFLNAVVRYGVGEENDAEERAVSAEKSLLAPQRATLHQRRAKPDPRSNASSRALRSLSPLYAIG